MKIYVLGGSEKEIRRITDLCLENGWEIRAMSRIGRPRADYPVQKVLDAYGKYKTVRATARILDISPGAVSRILKRVGALERGVVEDSVGG